MTKRLHDRDGLLAAIETEVERANDSCQAATAATM